MSNGELALLLILCALAALFVASILGGIVYVVLYVFERLWGLAGLPVRKKPEPKRTPKHAQKSSGWTDPPGWDRAGYDIRRDVQ